MIKAFKGKRPGIAESAFIAENAVVVGDVQIGRHSGIWYGVALRGDINAIIIGDETNIQEGSIIHVDTPDNYGNKEGSGRTVIGSRVTVGHGAILHACEIGDECLIGMGAIILSGAKIGAGSLVAAGSLVREGQLFPPGSLIAGNPAIVKKTLPPDQREMIKVSARFYADLADEHRSNIPL
ncbi:MAG: gamma carbonic anhydrase family protein [Candidatus Ozemobacteraceae bacterium]